MDDNKLITWINGELSRRGWSMRQLAQRGGLSHTQVSNVLAGKRNITFDFCAAIAIPLGKTPEELFRMAGLLPTIPSFDENSTLREIHEALKPLTDEEREEVLLYILWRREQKGRKPPSPTKPIPAQIPRPAPVIERLAMEVAAMDIDPELKKNWLGLLRG